MFLLLGHESDLVFELCYMSKIGWRRDRCCGKYIFHLTAKWLSIPSIIKTNSITDHHDYSSLVSDRLVPRRKRWSQPAVTHSNIKIHSCWHWHNHSCQISQGDLRKVPHSGTQQQRSAWSFVIPSPEPLDYLLSIDPEEAPRGPGLNTLISTPHLPAVRRLGRHRGVGRPSRRGNENTHPPSRRGCAQQRESLI